jgi:hypothetical protein
MSTVDANTADTPEGPLRQAYGGGIYAAGGLLLARSTVSRNDAASNGGQALGGGIALIGGSGTVQNSTLAANRARGTTARGGGIDTQADTQVANATIWGNTAKIGGGLYKETGSTVISATLLAGNMAPESPNCGGSIDSGGFNLVSNTTECQLAADGSNILNQPARLGPFGHHGGPTETVPLTTTSPAVNAIPKAACMFDLDQRGVARPQGNRCDIGAFELKR